MYRLLILLLILQLFLSACEQSTSPFNQAKEAQQSISYQGKAATPGMIQGVSHKAVLREKLPKNTVAYVRIPALWSFLSTPKNSVLSKALSDSEHIALVSKLRESLYQNIFKTNKEKSAQRLSLMLYHMRAPAELAVFTHASVQQQGEQATVPGMNNSNNPYLMLYTKLSFKNVAEFKQFFVKFLQEFDSAQELSELDSNGKGLVNINGIKFAYKFDASNGDFYSISGDDVSLAMFQQVHASLQKTKHPMHELENKIDQSGLGYFFWINSRTAYNALSKYLNALSSTHSMRMSMLFGMSKYIAGGWGVSQQKSRLKILVQITHMDLSRFFAPLGNSFNIKTAGTPSFVAAVAIPGPKQWQASSPFLKGPPGSYREQRFLADMQKMRATIGFDIEEFLNAIGPKLLIYTDAAGEYLALQIRDKQKFKSLLDKAVATAKLDYRRLNMSGVEVNYLQIPLASQQTLVKMATVSPFLLAIMKRKAHLYWTEQGDYLVLGSVPQMLVDQAKYTNKVNIDNWLKKTQRQSTVNSFLLLSTQIESTPRGMYYSYLRFLQVLGDMADFPIDLANMPSAMGLNLPIKGSYGMTLDINKDLLGVEFMFENNPLEFLVNMNVSTLVVAGVVAGVAIPAYNDYKVRSAVSSGVMSAEQYKRVIAEYYMKHKKFPDMQDLSQTTGFQQLRNSSQLASRSIKSITILPDTGKVMIRYTGSNLWGASILLSPIVENNIIVRWQCESTLPYRFTPKVCR